MWLRCEGGRFDRAGGGSAFRRKEKVEDPADELREMAESRAKAWQAESSAAEAWMAELKEFEESRESSSGAESMLTCSEVEVLAEERNHAGIVFGLSLSRERSIVRKGAEEPERTHLAAVVTGADMELDGTKDLVARSSRIGWARLSELEEKAVTGMTWSSNPSVRRWARWMLRSGTG